MKPSSRWIVASWVVLVCALGVGLAWAQAKKPDAKPELTADDLDAQRCQVWTDGKASRVDSKLLMQLLGIAQPGGEMQWTGGRAAGDDSKTSRFDYVIAFKKPMPVATVLASGAMKRIAVLSSDALPADASNDVKWTIIDADVRDGISIATFAQPVETRAIRLTDTRSHGRSDLGPVRIHSTRLRDVARDAVAFASSEWTFYPKMGAPQVHTANNALRGWGDWQSAGPDREQRITTPPVSDIDPAWYMIVWDEPHTVAGLITRDNFDTFELDTYNGPANVHPRAGVSKEWRRVKITAQQWAGAGGRNVWLEPVATRGLRFRITKTADPAFAKLDGVRALIDASKEPAKPAVDAATAAVRRDAAGAPVRFTVPIAVDGTVTAVINTPDGKRVRNLIAREAAKAGDKPVSWDLLDESGRMMSPGTYAWESIQGPPLEYRWEMCAYPNVRGVAPWLTGVNGTGGWLADHTPPSSLAVGNGRVYVGAYVAESGVCLLEADLDGKKLWGRHSFAAWTGPQFLAADNKTVYAAMRVNGSQNDLVVAIDQQTHDTKEIVNRNPSAERQSLFRGIAAREGKVYASISSDVSFLNDAMGAGDVDLSNSLPLYRESRGKPGDDPKDDPRADTLRLLRLEGSPAGHPQRGLIYLESTAGSGARQHIMYAFRRPIPIGSVVLPVPVDKEVSVQLSLAKADAPFPPNPGNPAHWQPFETQGKPGWDVATAPKATQTRALRVTFLRGEDDMFSQSDESDRFNADKAMESKIKAGETGGGKGKQDDTGLEGGAWKGKLEGMKILRRRFENAARTAKVTVNSGRIDKAGSWDAQRTKAITPDEPGVYMLEWKEPQAIRGLAIREIDGKRTLIDVFDGAEGASPSLDGKNGWRNVATYTQERRDYYDGRGNSNYNTHARYLDGYMDLGPNVKTRAIRLRVVEPFTDRGPHRPLGVRFDRGRDEPDAKRCYIDGVAALVYAGGEPPVDSLITDRIEVIDGKTGKIEKEISIERPRALAFDSKGRLHAATSKTVVRVDAEGKTHTPVVNDLKAPGPIAFDAADNLYVYDEASDRQVIRVYDASGKYLRDIGTPGGFRVGPWDPTRMENVSAIGVDHSLNQLWVCEAGYWPKRVTVWSTDGKFIREHLGNTAYGGGGVLNPWDKTQFFYGPLEFKLDWKTGETKLAAMTWRGENPGDIPMRVENRQYLVSQPEMSRAEQSVGAVYLYKDGVAKLVAAMGQAAAFGPLGDPAIRAKLGVMVLTQSRFVWSDLNEDGVVQAEEVKLSSALDRRGVTPFDRSLGAQMGNVRFEVEKYLPGGTPVYRERVLALSEGGAYRKLDGGTFYRMGHESPEAGFDADGKPRWTYPSDGAGVHALYSPAANRFTTAQIIAQFSWAGNERTAAGDLGEFVVMTGNTGQWNAMTSDGLLATRLFRDIRDPAAIAWSMSKCERGMPLGEITAGQEHFAGYFCRAVEDGKYYAVVGHNHASIVEVLGLEKFKRARGTLEVKPKDVADTLAWQRDRETRKLFERAPVVVCPRAGDVPVIDGSPQDWPEWPSASIDENIRFRTAFGDKELFVCFEARYCGPMNNTGQQWDQLFKSGAAVDLQIGIDRDAPEDRKEPAAGDTRVLLTFVDGKPAAVLYQPVAPAGVVKGEPWRVRSPVSDATFDRVVKLEGVRMATRSENDGYVVEAAIPLEAIGLRPEPDTRRRFDWGILVAGPEGHEVLRRVYWSNKATGIVSDAPSEAKLHPDLWGHVIFTGPLRRADRAPDLTKSLKTGGPGDKTSGQVDELLKDLEEDGK